MTRRALLVSSLAVAPGAALLLSGLASTPGAGLPPAAHAATAPTLRVADSRYGPIVVDRGGRTLYLFTLDTGRASRCSGACARAWPPALVRGRLQAGRGILRSLMGTIRRRDGGRQLAYAGHRAERFCPNAQLLQLGKWRSQLGEVAAAQHARTRPPATVRQSRA